MQLRSAGTTRLLCLIAFSFALVPPVLNAQGQRKAAGPAQGTVPRSAPTPPSISVAVVPLQQAVGSSDTAVLGQGLADSLANALKGLSRFVVADVETISNLTNADPTSQDIKKDEEAARIGKTLGVSFVVVGSYQIVGNQLIANCRIVNAASAQVLPGSAVSVSGKFPEDYARLLDDLNRKIVAAFRIQPTAVEAKRLRSSPASQSEKALLLYNQGLTKATDGTAESLRKAIDIFAECVAVDPGYAPAYAAKADTEARLAEMGKGQADASDLARQAEEDASTAVRSRPDLASAQRALARAYNAEGDYSAAAKAAAQAIQAAPNDAAARIALNRAQNNGELVPSSDMSQLLQKQPWISFLFDQFPKVLVRNDCDAVLSVTFAPSSGDTGPKLTVLPQGLRVVALFPGSYTTTFDCDAGDLVRQYELKRNELQELKFHCTTDITRTNVVIMNNGNSSGYVTFTHGTHVTNVLVNPGSTERRELQTGDYTITCAGAAGGRSLESRQATLRANSQYTYQCNVTRRLVTVPRLEFCTF